MAEEWSSWLVSATSSGTSPCCCAKTMVVSPPDSEQKVGRCAENVTVTSVTVESALSFLVTEATLSSKEMYAVGCFRKYSTNFPPVALQFSSCFSSTCCPLVSSRVPVSGSSPRGQSRSRQSCPV